MVSESDERIIRLVGRMTYVTPELVCRRFYSKRTMTYVQARLKELVTSNVLVRRGWSPGLGGGSRPYVYSLAPRTRSRLVASGVLPKARYRPSEDKATKQYPAHTLDVNEVLVTAELTPSFASFIHERTIQRFVIPYKPDAYIQFDRPGKPYGMLVEVDRDTEDVSFWQNKIESLVEFVNSDAYDNFFPHFDGVLIVGLGEARTTRLHAWTANTLTRLNIDGEGMFHYLTLAQAKDPEAFAHIL